MIRIKDPKKSLQFYRDILGMTLIAESHHSDFSLFFLALSSQNPLISEGLLQETLPDPNTPEAKELMKKMFGPVIELTHNHGTEDDPHFKYELYLSVTVCFFLILLPYYFSFFPLIFFLLELFPPYSMSSFMIPGHHESLSQFYVLFYFLIVAFLFLNLVYLSLYFFFILKPPSLVTPHFLFFSNFLCILISFFLSPFCFPRV